MTVRKVFGLFTATRRRFIGICLITLACGVGFGSSLRFFSIYAQSSKKLVVINDVTPDRQQIRIHEPKVGTKSVVFGTQFTEKGDWLSRTSFALENVSPKQIIYVRVNVWFPETTKSGQIMVYPLTFGKRPGSNITAEVAELKLGPREKLDVFLAPAYGKMSTFIGERQSIDTISEIKIEPSFIVFADGTAWSVGTFMQPDPNNPSRYIPITEKAREVQNE